MPDRIPEALARASTTDTLLPHLDPLPYSDRVRYMVALGRQSRTDAAAKNALAALASGGFYERLLLLLSCMGSNDGDHVLRSLNDTSRIIRGLAVKLVPHVCTDEQISAALKATFKQTQVLLLRSLIRRRRRVAIDTFLDNLAASGDDRLGELLPFGSATAVRRYLAAVSPRFANYDWIRLARQHPDIVLEAIQPQIQAQTESDPRLRSQVNALLPHLAKSRPDDALALVQSLLRFEPPVRLTLQRLAERRPTEITDLLLTHEDGANASVDLSQFAHRLPQDRLIGLLQYRPVLLPQRHLWLRRLSPELRRAAYAVAGNGWRDSEGVLDAETVTLLPGDLRENEGRRNFALPALATRPAQRLPYAAFLNWEEAKTALETSIRNPDADLRANALSALVSVARYHRERLPEVLALVRARANEQDPVRRAMLTSLAALPPSRWQDEHLEDLGQIIQDALNAADTSPSTANAAGEMIVALIPFHPTWSASWLGTLVKSRGQIPFYGLGDRLSDADVQRITPSLLPVFQAWATREREGYLLQAANSIGRRLPVFDGLTDLLEQVLTTTRQSYIASQILSLLAEHRPERLAALVPKMLQSDPSVITLPTVYNYLHRLRQDLLTPFLGQQAYAGRFSTGRTRFVLPLSSGFQRWTPTQQMMFAETLTRITHDEARDTPALFQALNQLAALPAESPTRLSELAAPSAERLAVRDAALRALAHLDGGQGLPTLIEALDDSRARIAIYALRSAIMEMPADRALSFLQQVPTQKVTVAKEVVRLLGELDTRDVYPVLLEMDTRPKLHRDVRVALLRALWDHLEREETWPILNRAATDSDPAVAAGVVRIPTDRLSPLVQQRLLDLIALLLQHTDTKVRMDTLSRCVDLPLFDANRVLLPPLLTLVGSPLPDECAATARAVFATYAGNAGQDAATVSQAASQVRSDRRVLLTILQTLQSTLTGNRGRLCPTVRAVLEALADDPLTARHRAELAVVGLPWAEVVTYLSRLADTNELHAEALIATVQAIEGSEASGIEILETAYRDSPDERLRRLGLAAVVAQAGMTPGWTPELRALLEIYRSDAAPLVAAAAQFTLPPPE